MTTVGELRKALEGHPDDKPILMSKDGEGNTFRPFYETSKARVEKADPFSPLDDEDYNLYPDSYEDVVDVLILWPEW